MGNGTKFDPVEHARWYNKRSKKLKELRDLAALKAQQGKEESWLDVIKRKMGTRSSAGQQASKEMNW